MDIIVEINVTAIEVHRIFGNKPPHLGIIISRPVEVKARFIVVFSGRIGVRLVDAAALGDVPKES